MNIRKWTTILGFICSLFLAAGSAQAALYSFEDDDIDFHLDANLNPKSGTFEVGDVLVAVFEIPTHAIDGTNAIPAGQELTGVAAIQITGFSTDPPTVGTTITFSPYSGGLNSVLALGTDPDASVVGGGAGEGAMLAMWFNGTDGAGGDTNMILDRTTLQGDASCTSLANCISQASLGDLYQVDGFVGDPDEFWISVITALGGADSGTVAGTANNNIVATFQAGLSNFFQDGATIGYIDLFSGESCAATGPVADGCVQATISGTITGGQGLTNGAFAHSDFDAQKHSIPEPSILGLLGIGLMGIFLARRRQQA